MTFFNKVNNKKAPDKIYRVLFNLFIQKDLLRLFVAIILKRD